MLDEELDYEPEMGDDVQEEENQDLDYRDQEPEPSGQEFQESSSNNTSCERQSLNNGTDLEGPSSIQSFRDNLKYINLHVDVDKDSCRSRYGMYGSEDCSRLDSSDEGEPEFSDGGYNENEYDVSPSNFEMSGENPYDEPFEPLEDPDFVGPESPVASESQSYPSCGDSNSTSYENMNPHQLMIPSSDSNMSSSRQSMNTSQEWNVNSATNQTAAPKKKSYNFTIQVVGKSRYMVPPVKEKQKPWLVEVRDVLDDIVVVTSNDEVIKYCPSDASRISDTHSFTGSQSHLSESSLPGPSVLSESSLSGPSVFKMPLKRPPTRQKSLKSLSVLVDQTGAKTVTETDNSDIISLIASTTIGDDQDEYRPTIDLQLKSEPLSSVPESVGSLEQHKISLVTEWVNKTKALKIPLIYRGLCYNYFFNDNCRSHFCRNGHFFPQAKITDLAHLPDNDFTEAYQFAKSNPFFYSKIYKHFAEIFGSKDNKVELINMVHIIFDTSNNINQVEGLRTVLENLQKTDFTSFEDTVEYFLTEIGLRCYPTLGEVLLEIMISRDVISCWPIMRRLFIAGEKIKLVKLASKFLVNLMKNPVDFKVCKEVYQHILKYQCLNLPAVPRDIRQPFLKLCTSGGNQRSPNIELDMNIARNLRSERNKFERNNLNSQDSSSSLSSQAIPTDFSVPPPNFVPLANPLRGPYTIQSPVGSMLGSSLSLAPTTNFGLNSGSQHDFASLSQQQSAFCEPAFKQRGDNNNVPVHPPFKHPHTSSSQQDFGLPRQQQLEFTLPAFNPRGDNRRTATNYANNNNVPAQYIPHPSSANSRKRCRSYNSSEDGDSTSRGGRLSDTDSLEQIHFNPPPLRLNPAHSSGLTYNREGLQYDPAKDYGPPQKRRYCDNIEPDLANENLSEFEEMWQETSNSATMVRNNARQPNQREEPSEFDKFWQSCDSVPKNVGKNKPSLARQPDQREEPFEFDKLRQSYNSAPRNVVRNKPSPARQPNQREPSETLVSSSSNPKSKRMKPPETPVFGEIYFDPNYEFNVSLHNLYLQKIDNVGIDEDDVKKLNDCVKSGDGKEFLDLVTKYYKPSTIQNFICMTLADLRGMNQNVARIYKALLASIEQHDPYFYGCLKVRVVLEVITMNLLFELGGRNLYEDAKDLLIKFSNWDSLVTSRLFITNVRTGITILGRYMLLANILTFSQPELAYEILVCPNLHLLEEPEKWPNHPQVPKSESFKSDLETRNNVLSAFLKKGYLMNTVVVIQMYKTALRKKSEIWSFDVRQFVNPMVVELLNRNQIVSLKQISSEIKLFYKHMDKNTLRALLLVMFKHLNKGAIFKLFEKCIFRNMYQRVVHEQALEHKIDIKTNMLPEEIEVIILYYFHKLVEIRNLPPDEEKLKFEIKFPGEDGINALTIPSHTDKTLLQVKNIIKNILMLRCNIKCEDHSTNLVEVDKTELIKYLQDGR